MKFSVPLSSMYSKFIKMQLQMNTIQQCKLLIKVATEILINSILREARNENMCCVIPLTLISREKKTIQFKATAWRPALAQDEGWTQGKLKGTGGSCEGKTRFYLDSGDSHTGTYMCHCTVTWAPFIYIELQWSLLKYTKGKQTREKLSDWREVQR